MRFGPVLPLLLLALPTMAGGSAPPLQSPLQSNAILAANSDTRWVPFDLTPGNQIRFDVDIDGKRASAVLDTGVSATVASRLFATRAGLRVDNRSGERAQAVGGAIPLGWATTRRLAFGGATQTGKRLAIVDLGAIATGSAKPVDLLVGSDLLSCCALDIDFQTRRFRLLPSGRMPFAGARAPLTRLPRTGVFASEATVGKRRVRPLIVDTGDGAALTLSRDAWSATNARARTMTTAVAFGLGGAIETEVTILPSVQLGTAQVEQVEARIEPAGGFSDQTATSGRIGTALLQRYRVLLDPGAGHMVLAPTARTDDPPVRSTSGLLVGYDSGRLSVLHVMRGSPAAQAGWRAREMICTVDGAAVPRPQMGTVDTGWSAGQPGRIVNFGMCDGTQRKLTLRQFY